MVSTAAPIAETRRPRAKSLLHPNPLTPPAERPPWRATVRGLFPRAGRGRDSRSGRVRGDRGFWSDDGRDIWRERIRGAAARRFCELRAAMFLRAQSAHCVCAELASRHHRREARGGPHRPEPARDFNMPPRNLKSHLASVAFPGLVPRPRPEHPDPLRHPRVSKAPVRRERSPGARTSPTNCRATAVRSSPASGTGSSLPLASRRNGKPHPSLRRPDKAAASPPRSVAC